MSLALVGITIRAFPSFENWSITVVYNIDLVVTRISAYMSSDQFKRSSI